MQSELIHSARRRLASTGKRTRHIDLRRAVSDTYYALFHALAQLCADELVGANKRREEAWARIYRALNHKQAKEQLKIIANRTSDKRIAEFSQVFSQFQEFRHSADYDPTPPKFGRKTALDNVDRAEQAINSIFSVPQILKINLATAVLFKDRS